MANVAQDVGRIDDPCALAFESLDPALRQDRIGPVVVALEPDGPPPAAGAG